MRRAGSLWHKSAGGAILRRLSDVGKFYKMFLSGPVTLNLYSVVEVRHCLKADVDEADKNTYQGLVIEFFLRKPLTGDFLTQILPTTLFVLIRLNNI